MLEHEAEETAKKSYIGNEINAFVDGATFGYNKANEYAKTIIKDLLDNSDEYARQRAIEFLKETLE